MIEVVFLAADLALMFLLLRWSVKVDKGQRPEGVYSLFNYRD